MAQDFSFCSYTLSQTERVLRFRGAIVPLPPKAVDLLIALLREPGRVVSKETLLAALWGDTAIEEGNLNQAAFRLRRALEQCDPSVRIETVPRRGYRLVLANSGAAKQWAGAARPWYAWPPLRLAALGLSILAAAAVSAAGNVQTADVDREIGLGYVTWSQARSAADIDRSIEHFKLALQAAPNNSQAQAGIAYALLSRALRDSNNLLAASDAQAALDHAREAVSLDPSCAQAHAAWGQWHALFGSTHIADRELRRAVSLDPESTPARTWYGELLIAEGRPAAAATQLEAALTTGSTWTEPSDDLALLAYLRRAFGQAQAYARQSIVLNPSDRAGKLFLAVSEAASQPSQAEADVRAALGAAHGDNLLAAHALLGYVYAVENRAPSAMRQLRDAQAVANSIGVVSDPFTVVSLAGTYALEHQRDDAFAWLSRLDRSSRKVFAGDRRLDSLRPDPRFAAWLRD